ncbi:TolC family protein, partial [Pyxidicoccus sp. 3LG]
MLAVPAALSLMLASAPVDAWTLERVVMEALEHSPEVAAAQAEEAGAEDARAADGRWLRDNPQVELSVASDALTGDQGELRLEAMLSQTVEVAGQRGARVKRAEASLEAAGARRRAAVLAV